MPKYRDAAKSELDSQRELLDSLMGINRNNDKKYQNLDYRDDRVCKFFLTGMCPHDMFVNTKMDEGPCDKIHSEALKANFEKSGDIYMFDNFIEREFQARLAESEKIIRRARQRVEEEKADEELNPELNPEVIKVHAEMANVIALAENFAEIGDIDNCFELMAKLEDLQREKTGLINKINDIKKQRIGNGTDKKLRVCDVCGSFLSIFDSDKRLTDHFIGKQHIGFQYMRDVVAAIQKRREERRAQNPNQSSNDNNRSSYRNDGGGDRNNNDDDRRRYDNYRRDDYRRDSYGSGGGGGGRRDDYNRGGGDSRYRDDYRNRDGDYRRKSGGGDGYYDNNRGRNNNRDNNYRDNRRRSRSRS